MDEPPPEPFGPSPTSLPSVPLQPAPPVPLPLNTPTTIVLALPTSTAENDKFLAMMDWTWTSDYTTYP
ncbi:hypothetical protein DM01DRAFT_1337905 [Hesseltinella vesiculosa]|uniref:Uncharacterized protein n=1 Tax=Hesseltinella vesiculosa TaxID=101127 RepID=A0A1X2GC37_9FUNG|nr:hypothetical protein DM01DRAFT_1337905 [Hesseltinella vesiculosa]